MAKPKQIEGTVVLVNLSGRLTVVAMNRLKAECERRFLKEVGHVPLGRVINELIMEHLPPTPDEGAVIPIASAREQRKRSARSA